jgi:hypothetical protein
VRFGRATLNQQAAKEEITQKTASSIPYFEETAKN